MSEVHRAQLLWGRTVNTSGRQGANIPCDLHLEHLNRRLKTQLRHLQSNVTTSAVVRAGKSIGVVNSICHLLESELKSGPDTSKHSFPSFEKDFNTLLSALEESKVFSYTVIQGQPRQYGYVIWRHGLLHTLGRDKLLDWIERQPNQAGILPPSSVTCPPSDQVVASRSA